MKIHSYQVSVRKAGGNFIRRNAEEMLVTREERKLTTRNLEMGEVYEFRVWCKVQRCLPFTFNTHQEEWAKSFLLFSGQKRRNDVSNFL